MTMQKKSIITALVLGITILLNACATAPGTQTAASAPADFAKKLQEDLIKAKPGSVIEIPAGKFKLDKTLSLNVAKVTIRGKGMDKTILSFTGQKAGSAGMMVKADDFVIAGTTDLIAKRFRKCGDAYVAKLVYRLQTEHHIVF